MSEFTQFDYLLNAFERASQDAAPGKRGYAGKRQALYAYVRELEARTPPTTNGDKEGARVHFEQFHAFRKSKGVARREALFDRFPDGSYKDESVQRHWWTWQNAAKAPPTAREGDGKGRDDAIAVAVATCIEFGAQGVNRPPDGHWLMRYWELGRALASSALTPKEQTNAD